ncbi:MAG: hypothetical protein KME27_13635 [Lyngbya sp. HA4199-MV5]|jgi:hypothetical protein|nr:hypothetical protein [Lyngbya sp. HA4199-MV5]
MSRLVIAILILFAVLIGLRSANSSLFRLNFFNNQSDSLAPATRNTGFSAESTASSGGVAQGNFNPGQPDAGTTALPPQTEPAVPARW